MRSLCCYISLLFILSQAAYAQRVSGVVKSERTRQGVPFVNIGIPARSFGMVSEEDGSFGFNITNEQDADTIRIFSMSYKPVALTFGDFRGRCERHEPLYLTEVAYQLATTTVRPNDYETKVMGSKNVADLECINLESLTAKDTALQRKFREKGLSDKAIGIELGNKIKIDKGQQTFIDKVQFKTCEGPKDTAIYRINIYSEGKTLEKHITPIGMVRMVSVQNVMKEPLIVKCIGKTEVQDLDLSAQNIEVEDDFIIALECIYSSNRQMNIGAKAGVFGSTDLLFRTSIMEEWVKIPLLDITFISATVTYKKKKGFFARLFD